MFLRDGCTFNATIADTTCNPVDLAPTTQKFGPFTTIEKKRFCEFLYNCRMINEIKKEKNRKRCGGGP